jgi:glycosyltransferase 2 family protein
MIMTDWRRWLPGAIISIILIIAILSVVHLRAVADAIRHANCFFLAIAMVLSFIWIAVRAQVWRTLLRDRPSYRDTFWTVGEGYLLNNCLPFRLGEIGRAFLLSRKTDMQFMEILPTIMIERATDLGYTVVIFLSVIPFIFSTGTQGNDAKRIGMIVGVVVLAGFALLYILARSNQWALDLFHKLSARWPVLQRFGGSFLESFFAGLSILTDGWLFVRFLFWMTLNWVLAIVSNYFIIRAFFPETQVAWAMFGLGAAAFGGAIPALPGAVGAFEGAFGGALTLLTHDQSTAFAVAIIARLFSYFNSGIIGGIGLMRESETLSGVYKQVMNLRNKEQPE